MKKIYLIFMFLVLSSTCYAASIAIEFQENNKFAGIIGKAYYTGESIEIVTFIEKERRIVPHAWIYQIIEKESKREGIYHLKCRNQLGVIASGTINLKDYSNPKITLISDLGIVITNISMNGKKMKEQFLPKIDLGR